MAKNPLPRRKASGPGPSRRAAPPAPKEAPVEPPSPPDPPRGPGGPTLFRPAPRRPSGARQGGPVFGVGRQAFVDGQGQPKRRVGLVDEKALVSVGSLADGTEVEILGWVPKGPATRYLVRSTKDGVEGWLGAANLRATRRPLAPGAEPRELPPVSIPPRMPRGEVARRATPPPVPPTKKGKKPAPPAKGAAAAKPAKVAAPAPGKPARSAGPAPKRPAASRTAPRAIPKKK